MCNLVSFRMAQEQIQKLTDLGEIGVPHQRLCLHLVTAENVNGLRTISIAQSPCTVSGPFITCAVFVGPFPRSLFAKASRYLASSSMKVKRAVSCPDALASSLNTERCATLDSGSSVLDRDRRRSGATVIELMPARRIASSTERSPAAFTRVGYECLL